MADNQPVGPLTPALAAAALGPQTVPEFIVLLKRVASQCYVPVLRYYLLFRTVSYLHIYYVRALLLLLFLPLSVHRKE